MREPLRAPEGECLTVKELRDWLATLPDDWPLLLEGCDCFNWACGAEVEVGWRKQPTQQYVTVHMDSGLDPKDNVPQKEDTLSLEARNLLQEIKDCDGAEIPEWDWFDV